MDWESNDVMVMESKNALPTLVNLPPDHARICSIKVAPHPDRRRLRIELEHNQTLLSPDIDIMVTDTDGKVVAGTSIIGTAERKLHLTLHMVERASSDRYAIQVSLQGQDEGQIHQETVDFIIPGELSTEGD